MTLPEATMTDLEKLLQPAWGYLQLGMLQEANDEIENLPPAVKTVKEVLILRAYVYQEAGAWELLREVGCFLTRTWPEDYLHWIWLAYGTRGCRTLEEAEQLLLEALRLHDSEPMVHFKLASYAALLGRLDEARQHLARAIALKPDCRVMALDEAGLEPLWDELRKPPPLQPPTHDRKTHLRLPDRCRHRVP